MDQERLLPRIGGHGVDVIDQAADRAQGRAAEGPAVDHRAGREVGHLVDWGMSPLQALVAATANGAENLGLDDVGYVRQGHVADLALWDDNPVEDPAALVQRPRAVFRAGVRIRPRRD